MERARSRRTGVGDASLDDLYTEFGAAAYGLAVEIVGDETAAKEIVCAAFVETWGERADSRAVAGTHRPLLASVHRRAAAFVRSSEPGSRPAPPADSDAREMLAGLPDPEREAIERAYFGCYTLSEIATDLDTPVETVRAHVSAGLGRLREAKREALPGQRANEGWWQFVASSRVFRQTRVRGIR